MKVRPLLVCLLLAAWAASPATAGEVRVLADLAYKTGPALSEYERTRCQLDLFLPDGSTGFATVVWFHGGSLTAGAKGDATGLARRLASAGVAVAAVNYRLSPRVSFPAYIEDAAAAFAWVHAHISEHGGDSRRVFVGGHSAGGYLTLMLGLDPRYVTRQGLTPAAIAGLVPVSGQTMTHYTVREERGLPRDTVIADAAAPVHFAHHHVPPLLILWASDDLPARAEENIYLAALLRTGGRNRVTTAVMPGRDHGTIVSAIDAPDDQLIATLLRFVAADPLAR